MKNTTETHRYLAFISGGYLRDAQAYLGCERTENIESDDIWDEEHEPGWRDVSGDMLVLDKTAANEADIWESLKKCYPHAPESAFYIIKAENAL